MSRERTPPPNEHWMNNPRSVDEYYQTRCDWYRGLLFDAWKVNRGQTKGLQRQRRLINRLRARIAELESQVIP